MMIKNSYFSIQLTWENTMELSVSLWGFQEILSLVCLIIEVLYHQRLYHIYGVMLLYMREKYFIVGNNS